MARANPTRRFNINELFIRAKTWKHNPRKVADLYHSLIFWEQYSIASITLSINLKSSDKSSFYLFAMLCFFFVILSWDQIVLLTFLLRFFLFLLFFGLENKTSIVCLHVFRLHFFYLVDIAIREIIAHREYCVLSWDYPSIETHISYISYIRQLFFHKS